MSMSDARLKCRVSTEATMQVEVWLARLQHTANLETRKAGSGVVCPFWATVETWRCNMAASM